MHIQAVLLDIDGTLMIGTEPIPGAAETLRYLAENRIPYRFISNGTRRSRANVLKKLERLGAPVSRDQIVTPAVAAIAYLKRKGITACNLLVTEDLLHDFTDNGISPDPGASTIVIGDAADGFTYHAINRAFRSLLSGGELIALEKDRYWKDTDGYSLGAGPFVSALEYAAGCRAILMGKPSPLFFAWAEKGLSAVGGRTAMIGDDLMTDIKGAQDAGLLGILVFTGKTTENETESGQVNPDASLASISLLPRFLETGENHPVTGE
ncbi:MAG: TIGR01458 family HAD-type hydrolase [Methanospirillum sp.]|nr:TIGR01458 family HAD-type hydrolase [Methanospirillum sp.]